MKKHLKLLVLVLALALIVGTVAIVASADGTEAEVASVGDVKYATLAEAIGAAEAGATVKLISDTTVSAQIDVAKNVTVDLGGCTVTSTVAALFNITADVDFNIIGEGDIETAGIVIASKGTNAPNVNVTASGKGIFINHTGASDSSVVEVVNGNYHLTGINVTATVKGENAVFEILSGGTAYMEIKNSHVASDVTDNVNASVVTVQANGSVKFLNCYVHSSSGFSRLKGCTAANPLTIENSVLLQEYHEGLTEGQRKSCYIYGWGDSAKGGKVLIKDSLVQFCYRFHCATEGGIDVVNSTIRGTGYSGTAASADHSLARYKDVNFDATSLYIVNRTDVGETTSSGTDGKRGQINIVPGFRTNNEKLTKAAAAQGFIDPDGTFVSESDAYKFVYDPVGNPDAPYVFVKVGEESAFVKNTMDADVLRYYDNSDLYTSELNGVIGYDDEDNHRGALLNGSMFGFVGSNVGYQWNIGSYAGCGTSMVKTVNGNTFYKYWVNPTEAGGATRSLVGVNDKNKSPNLLPANKTVNLADNRVIVYDIDIATDSTKGFPALYVQLQNSGSRLTYLNVANDGTASGNGLTGGSASSVKLSYGEWHRISFVIYGETKTVHVFVNGQYLGHKNENADITSVSSLRIGAITTNAVVDSTLLLDNAMVREYQSYKKGDASDNQLPAEYLSTLPMNTLTGEHVTAAGKAYADVDEAMAAANALGTNAVLHGDVVLSDTVTTNGYVIANGYTINLGDGSYGADIGYAKDGGVAYYEFNETYNDLYITYGWHDGSADPYSGFTEVNVKVGQIPTVPDGVKIYPAYQKTEEGKYLIANHTGWTYDYGSNTPIEFTPVTVADVKAAAGYPKYVYPTYVDEYVDNKYTWVVVDYHTGAFKRGGTENNMWGSKLEQIIALRYGETLVITADTFITGGYTQFKFGAAGAGSEKVLGFDINGYKIFFDPTGADTRKCTCLWSVKTGETLNVYSSRPGGVIESEGLNDANVSKKEHYDGSKPIPSNASTKSASGGVFFQMIGATDANGSMIRNHEGSNGDTNQNTHLTIGAYNGNYAGNLTLICSSVVAADTGDKTCSVTIDGLKAIRNAPDYAAMVFTRYFYGTVNVKNSTFIDPVAGQVFGAHGEAATVVDGELTVSPTGTMNIDNCLALVAKNGTGILSDTHAMGTVTFTNFVTNGSIRPTKDLKANVIVGEGCMAYSFAPSAYAEGVVPALNNYSMNIEGDTLDVNYIYVKATAAGTVAYKGDIQHLVYTFATAGYEGEADLVLPVLQYKTTKDTVKVTFEGIGDNEDIVLTYAKGGKVVAPEIAPVVYNALKLVHDGSFNASLPESVDSDVTFTPGVKTESAISGVKINLSIYSDFGINVYIPAEYKEYIKSVKSGGASLVLTDVTIGDAEYIKVTANKTADKASENAVFSVSISEGIYTTEASLTVNVAAYAKAILSDTECLAYTAADRMLMYYMVNYANEAAKYFGGAEDASLASMLTTYADAKGEGVGERIFNTIADPALGDVFTAASVKLTATPAFVLTVKDGFEGTVTVAYGDITRTYKIAADSDRDIVIEGMKIYNFGLDLTINAEGTIGETSVKTENASYNLDTYVQYHLDSDEAESVACAELLRALFDYVTCAEGYVA